MREKGKDKSARSRDTETPPEEGKGTVGDVPGYNPTPTETGFMPILARIWTEASATNWCGRRGGVTSRSCHQGAMTRQVVKSGVGPS